MGHLVLYGFDASPPVRACLLTLKELKLQFEYKEINLFKKENHSEEFLKKNPQHTVPVLEDDGAYITDSHAIMAYLVRTYGKDDQLYPKDFLKRALVDQRLHMETGVLFQALRNLNIPIFFKNETAVPQSRIDAVIRIYELLDKFLTDVPYLGGHKMTIADFSNVATVTSLEAYVPVDVRKYSNLYPWLRQLELLPYYEKANGKGAKIFAEALKAKNITIVPSDQ